MSELADAHVPGSDFDRPPPGVTPFDNLRVVDQNGFGIAIDNIYKAGIEIVSPQP